MARDTPDLDYFDVDYYSRRRCRKCRVTSQLTNIQMLSNKQQQYKRLVDFKGECPDYLPETFSFTRDETHTLKHHFNNTRSWIIKPVGGSFRNGVQVVKSWEETTALFKNHLGNNGFSKDLLPHLPYATVANFIFVSMC